MTLFKGIILFPLFKRAQILLWDGIRKNQETNVNVILGANFPVNVPLNPLGMTALHFACSTSTQVVI